jgi:hypothetical protein
VSRFRIGVVLALVATGAIAALVPTSPSRASAQRRPWTHRLVSAKGQLVEHWTYDDPAPCGAVGDGTVTLQFQLVKPRLVTLIIDGSKNGEPNNTLGSWIVGIPGPTGGIRDTPALPASGTMTWVDNTTQRPPDPESGDCTPTDKTGCGTVPVARGSKTTIAGYNRRFLYADFAGGSFAPRHGDCGHGQVEIFDQANLVGGPREGQLLIRMPSAATVKRRHTLKVVGTSHKRTSFADCGSGASCTDDVTRRVTVVFKHL